MTKTYRYTFAGPTMADFQKQTGIQPEVIAKSSLTIDLRFDDACRDDMDEFMLERGFEFDSEIG
jgi:hypothetical protein